MRDIGGFGDSHVRHTMLIAKVLLVVELLSAMMLLWMLPNVYTISNMGLLVIGWVITFGYCVPSHESLEREYDRDKYELLMRMNMYRIVIWTIRSMILIHMGIGNKIE
jgi:hypothetical protein